MNFKYILLACVLLLIIPGVTSAATKSDACTYKEGTYKETLQVTGLKNASVDEFWKKDYYDHNELWYVVRQKNMYSKGKKMFDDYSIYSYNCKTNKPRRVIWQMTFREIIDKIPENGDFKEAKLSFIGGNFMNISFYEEGASCVKSGCVNFYNVSINFSPHTFSVAKRIFERGPNEYDTVGTYNYYR